PHAGGEALPDQLVADAHIGKQRHRVVFRLAAAANDEPLAHRHESRIALDVGDQIEHLVGRVLDDASCLKFRHLSAQPCVNYQAALAATVALVIRSGSRTGSPRLILSTFSMPSVTLPHTVY